MRKAFTLLELLTVIGMMSVLGAVSVVAGLSVSRGLEDRAARQALVGFLSNARRFASVEGVRTEVVFTRYDLAETEDDPPAEMCRAVAGICGGRITRIEAGHPWDEFAEGGTTALDETPGVFLFPGEQKIGSEYGIAVLTLELPKDYTVEAGRVRFVPTADGFVQMDGSVTLNVRRADGSHEQIGSSIGAAETEGLE